MSIREINVIISGMGVISACGKNISETLDNLAKGQRNAGEATLFKTKLKYPVFLISLFE